MLPSDKNGAQVIQLAAIRYYLAIEKLVSARFWKVRVVLAVVGLSVLMQCPRYSYLYRYAIADTETNPTYTVFKAQIKNPFQLYALNPDSHEAKMAFRLLPPILIKISYLPPIGIFMLQFMAGIAMYFMLITIIQRIADDRVVTVCTLLGLSCTYYGANFLFDVIPTFDAFAYALIIAMFLAENWLLIALAVFLGAFNDERVLLVLPIVLLWHTLHEPAALTYQWRKLVNKILSFKSLGVVVGVLTYALARYYVAVHFDVVTHKGAVGIPVLINNAYQGMLGIGIFSALESFWLYPAIVVFFAITYRTYKLPLLLLAAMLPIVLAGSMVFDVTRSISYGMPIFLVCMRVVHSYLPAIQVRNLAAFVMVGAIAIPTLYIIGKVVAAFSVFNYFLSIIHA